MKKMMIIDDESEVDHGPMKMMSDLSGRCEHYDRTKT